MLKKIALLSLLITSSAYAAETYNVIITKDHNEYLEIEAPMIYTSCLDILNKGASVGDGDYSIELLGVERTVTCDMTTDGGGWTQTFSRYFVDVQNGPTNTEMQSSIQDYTDLGANEVLIDLETRWLVLNGITAVEYDWMWDSGHGHEFQNIASSVDTSIGVTYAGSEVVWSHWATEIYQLNKNAGVWDNNVIFDLGNDSNHGAAFWDAANGTYKRLDGYQSPENVTMSIWAR